MNKDFHILSTLAQFLTQFHRFPTKFAIWFIKVIHIA